MTSDKKRVVSNLRLKEVSHVDSPANKQSRAALWKRDETKGGEHMDPAELAKKLEQMEKDLQKSKEENVALTAQVASLKKSAEEAGLAVDGDKIAKREVEEYLEVDGQKIAKSSVPAAVLALLEKSDREKRELIEKQEHAALLKRADDEIPNLVGTAEERAALLKSVDAIADSAKRESVMKSLKSADEAMKKYSKETGSDSGNGGSSEDDAAEMLDKKVDEVAKAKNISKAEAYAEVLKSDEGRKLAASGMAKKTK